MYNEYRSMVSAGRSDSRKLVRVEHFPLKTGAESSPGWTRADQDPNAKYAVITMDDEPTLNSLTPAFMIQVHDAIYETTRDPAIKIVVLTGVGGGFCSGGNLEMISQGARAVHQGIDNPSAPGAGTAEPWRWIRQQFGGVARLIATSNALFIASVNGVAAGVGLAFALACDVIIMSDKARLVPAFGKLGLVPEVGTSYLLTRKLGYQGALNFFVQGQHVSGPEALKLGLCQMCVPHAELGRATQDYVAKAAQMPSHTLEMTKILLRSVLDVNFDSSLRMEEFAEANCFSTRALPLAAEAILKPSRPRGKL
jgi:2-(1,2-epoxy-1,2-dihydrophenyl)acetyl-CoA isomerase